MRYTDFLTNGALVMELGRASGRTKMSPIAVLSDVRVQCTGVRLLLEYHKPGFAFMSRVLFSVISFVGTKSPKTVASTGLFACISNVFPLSLYVEASTQRIVSRSSPINKMAHHTTNGVLSSKRVVTSGTVPYLMCRTR